MALSYRSIWVAAAAAAICVINVVWLFRRKKEKQAKPFKESLLGGQEADAHEHDEPTRVPVEQGDQERERLPGGKGEDAPAVRNSDDRNMNEESSKTSPISGSKREPVDADYLQVLLESEFGPPKFEVRKSEDAGADSLKALLDREFGPPKFAVQKPASAKSGDSSGSGALAASVAVADIEPVAAPAHALLTRAFLQLEVIAGPAKGKVFRPADEQIELTIGRLPVSALSIPDQEMSGRHAVVYYAPEDDCWRVMDPGSLNGSCLNGTSISSQDRRPGQQHVLSDGDMLQLGEVTIIKVACGIATPLPQSKRRAPTATWGPGSQAAMASLRQSFTTTKLPPLQMLEEFPEQGLRMAVHQRVGTDHLRTSKPIEDVVLHCCPFEAFDSGTALFCVFDGHSGSQAALKAKTIVPDMLAAKLKPNGTGALVSGRTQDQQKQLLTEVFLEVDAQIATDEGCTATVVLMQQGPENQLLIQAANVGDSSAVVVDTSARSWSQLTADHRIANSSSERERLQERGHTVKKRLYGLNISRMLGDRFLKDEDLGFIAEPHVSPAQEIPAANTCFMIVASDGLWDVITEERAASLVLKAYEDDPSTTTAELIADMLLNQALSLRSTDDITVIVVEKRSRLQHSCHAKG